MIGQYTFVRQVVGDEGKRGNVRLGIRYYMIDR